MAQATGNCSNLLDKAILMRSVLSSGAMIATSTGWREASCEMTMRQKTGRSEQAFAIPSVRAHAHALESFGHPIEKARAKRQAGSNLCDRQPGKGAGEFGEASPRILFAAGQRVGRRQVVINPNGSRILD